MSELKAAAEAVRNLAKTYRAVLDLGEAVGKIADLESFAVEVENRKRAADAAIAATQERLAQLHQQETEAADRVAALVKRADQIARDTTDNREKALAEAAKVVARVQEEARSAAAGVRLDLERERQAHVGWQLAAAAEKKQHQVELQRIKDQIAELKARLG